jgi:hypothetical protein
MDLMLQLTPSNQMSLLLLLLLKCHGCNNCCTSGQGSIWHTLLCHTMLH